MQKVLVMYNLKPGVKIEDYRSHMRDELKTVPFQPGVKSFQVYEIRGAENAKPPYQIVEDVDVESFEAWLKVLKSEAMKKGVTEWDKYGDASSMIMIYGDKIE